MDLGDDSPLGGVALFENVELAAAGLADDVASQKRDAREGTRGVAREVDHARTERELCEDESRRDGRQQ